MAWLFFSLMLRVRSLGNFFDLEVHEATKGLDDIGKANDGIY
jgi:hypothetical protein